MYCLTFKKDAIDAFVKLILYCSGWENKLNRHSERMGQAAFAVPEAPLRGALITISILHPSARILSLKSLKASSYPN